MLEPQQKRLPGTRTRYTDKHDRKYKLFVGAENEVRTAFDGEVIASLYLQYDGDSVWRVQRAWVDEGFRKVGIATAMYDFAFNTGYRPLRGSRTQTVAGVGLWKKHIREKLATKGDFSTADHPNQHYWWPETRPVPKRGRDRDSHKPS